MLSILCFLPIREGVLRSRSLERFVLAFLAIVALLALCLALHAGIRAALQRRRFRKSVLLAMSVCVIALVSADLFRWVRPSGMSAVACTTILFQKKERPAHLLELHGATIADQASRQNLPASLLAAVIVDHQNQQTVSGDFSDCAGSALGVNPLWVCRRCDSVPRCMSMASR